MNFRIERFKDIDRKRWDAWLAGIRTGGYHHCHWWLEYCAGFQNVLDNGSFVLFENAACPLAVCPLFLSEIDGRRELSVNGSPFGAPAIAAGLRHGERRRVLDAAFTVMTGYAAEKGAERISIVSHPLAGVTEVLPLPCNLFELIRYRLLYRVENTLVIDLLSSEDSLALDMGKYQRRHVSRGRKQGIIVKAFNGGENAASLVRVFGLFQEAHVASAGRLTRPQATWDTMLKAANEGNASLFAAYLEGEPMSYLFCGEYGRMAFGWSQANIEKYEAEYSPRHLLEWGAILHYKRRGFRFYEVGERYFGPQPFYIPSKKELTISDFKERYGGLMLPKVFWLGYYSPGRMKEELETLHRAFMAVDGSILVPAEENI